MLTNKSLIEDFDLVEQLTDYAASTISAGAPYGIAYSIEYDTDRQGGDIRHGFPVDNVSQCMAQCSSSADCKAFTFVPINGQPPHYSNDEPRCWLKNSVPGKRREIGMITGIKTSG